jgi:YfiH family protein
VSVAGEPLALGAAGRVLFTGRAHGNLPRVGGAGAANGALARGRLRELTGVEALARGYQVHGALVRRVSDVPAPEQPGLRLLDADGQATALSGVGVMVLSADCLPVALGGASAVAMVHAGWRGLAAGVLEAGVLALRELGEDSEIVAVIGPGAGVCCYQVGEDVRRALGGAHRPDRHVDLRAIARARLLAAGVAEVRDVDVCTICDERFFSHRREGAEAGRQGGIAWLS